jgi:hypothetical protein
LVGDLSHFAASKLPNHGEFGTLEHLSRQKSAGNPYHKIPATRIETLTTSHIERAFLTVRQELKRYSRKTLAYSKDLEMHKAAVALHFGVYNLVRRHKTIGTTPAVAAGVEWEPWTLERVVEITEEYLRRKEDVVFEAAFAEVGL